ncbi:hypothetical protein GCM10023310_67790 [Paenibacillus vulneris]|uniref:Uncharacterized protein n=1 Tax=Paenibacillus vulneris TaxID=1133364 RepID=A0ABW3UFN3_9BACL|nr:hypothetical protein [Paenibacillus sp. 32352]
MKKMKSLLLSAFVLIMVFAIASSAYANTYRKGTTYNDPMIFYGYSDNFRGYFTSYSDADYYKHTNTSSAFEHFYINFDTIDDRSYDYFISSIGVTGLGSVANRVFSATGRESWEINLAPGGVLDIKAKPFNPSKVDQSIHYEIWWAKTPLF